MGMTALTKSLMPDGASGEKADEVHKHARDELRAMITPPREVAYSGRPDAR